MSSSKKLLKKTSIPKQHYAVEALRQHKKEKGQDMYLVKWQGYGEHQNTWEPVRNLAMIQEMIDDFHSRMLGESRPTKKLKKCPTASKAQEIDTIHKPIDQSTATKQLDQHTDTPMAHNDRHNHQFIEDSPPRANVPPHLDNCQRDNESQHGYPSNKHEDQKQQARSDDEKQSSDSEPQKQQKNHMTQKQIHTPQKEPYHTPEKEPQPDSKSVNEDSSNGIMEDVQKVSRFTSTKSAIKRIIRAIVRNGQILYEVEYEKSAGQFQQGKFLPSAIALKDNPYAVADYFVQNMQKQYIMKEMKTITSLFENKGRKTHDNS